MASRKEEIELSVSGFLVKHPKDTQRYRDITEWPLGALSLDYVETPQNITVGKIGIPSINSHVRLEKWTLATFVNIPGLRQLWVPSSEPTPFDVKSARPFKAEITATNESLFEKGWFEAQLELCTPSIPDEAHLLLNEARGYLKAIGAIALEEGDVPFATVRNNSFLGRVVELGYDIVRS